MKNLVFIILFVMALNSFKAQTTAIPDTNFEQALINLGYDIGLIDGFVLTANIDTVTNLKVFNNNISDLTGIEDFTALTFLNCRLNLLSNLDITQNLSLQVLICDYNSITSLDVTQNIALDQIICSNNLLISLDVTQNLSLQMLICDYNSIASIDLSQNTVLTFLQMQATMIVSLDLTNNTLLENLDLSNNSLTSLNLSQNSNLEWLDLYWNQLTCLNIKNGNTSNITKYFDAAYNSNLTCIEVDNVAWARTNLVSIDSQTSFSTNCANPCSTFGVGIDELLSSTINIYPNPAFDNITIDLKGKIEATVTIYNISGKIIFNYKYDSDELIEINLDTPPGLYFVQIETKGEIITKKIIKN